MTDHANELRWNARKIGRPSGDVPAVMHAAAAHIEDLERKLREAEARVAAASMAAYGEARKGTNQALSAEISAEYPQFFPRWPNHAAAMTDRIFHEARGIMGTENYGQEEALRMALLHVMRACSGSKGER